MPRKGQHHTAETRAKIGAAHKGRTISAEQRAKQSAAVKGRPLSAEHRAKLSAALKGRHLSAEHRAKLSASNTGRAHSAEQRAKILESYRRNHPNDQERFWSKVEKRDDDGCWVWTAHVTPDGYGQFRYRGRKRRAHTVAWELTYGPVPDGLCVLHRCDNPLCVRPDHLFIGTQSDNVRDCISKGRRSQRAGEKDSTAKLTVEQAQAIHQRMSSGERAADLARAYGVCQSTIYNIKNGVTYASATGLVVAERGSAPR